MPLGLAEAAVDEMVTLSWLGLHTRAIRHLLGAWRQASDLELKAAAKGSVIGNIVSLRTGTPRVSARSADKTEASSSRMIASHLIGLPVT